MRTPLQEQLLKAGLAKKNKVAEAMRAQKLQRDGKSAPADDTARVNAEKVKAERIERDRAISAERNAQARAHELQAQVRQIVETHKIASGGQIEYRFTDETAIRSMLVDATQRSQLAKGALVIVRHDAGYALVPRAAAEMIRSRNGVVVLDHGVSASTGEPKPAAAVDDYYDRFVVPDDLIW